jgi:hypothetical protein
LFLEAPFLEPFAGVIKRERRIEMTFQAEAQMYTKSARHAAKSLE